MNHSEDNTTQASLEHNKLRLEKLKRVQLRSMPQVPLVTQSVQTDTKVDNDVKEHENDDNSESSCETEEEPKPKSRTNQGPRRWLSPYEYAKKMNFKSKRYNCKRYDEPRSFEPKQYPSFNDRWNSNKQKSWTSSNYKPKWNYNNQRRSSASYSTRSYKNSYDRKPYKKPYNNFANKFRRYKSY